MNDRRLMSAGLMWVLWLYLATTAGAAMWVGSDDHPQQVAPNAWHFAIRVPVRAIGGLQFVGSQYDFLAPTQGIAVDYRSDGMGVDFADRRNFLAIAPTLYNQVDGFINGWSADGLGSRTFSGIVYATAPLTNVSITIIADRLMPMRRWQR